jgi:glutathione S-transferase
MLEEIGVGYEHIPIRPYTQSREAAYLRVNPNGRIPTLDDDGFVLWESLAINLYLGERYGGSPLWPSQVQDRARVYQWSLWAANEVETRLVSIARGLSRKSGDPVVVAAGIEQLLGALGVLESQLGGRVYLLGDDFTVADVNLAATLREPGESGVAGIGTIDLGAFPNVGRWLDACSDRPANRRVTLLP